ncbi:Endonuclease 8 [Paraconexibacter sp. AEG42_29]|uniref:DNA-(apurinic or apyrimidinic site) lyase n=1 Tax=Paraconexibacter sp. AEG42_29 TaxID=2997339 RepID=A0AAU7B2V6_9ACTN
MPEGDTIHYAANRIRPVLEGVVPDELRTPHPRFGRDRWPARLADRAVTGVDAHGKHLFLRFDGDLVIHSHLRMTGSWGVHPVGQRWKRAPRRAWLVVRAGDVEVVQFDGPILELMTAARARGDRRLALLGPDILAPDAFDERRFLRRLREDDPTRTIGDALLDQRTVAGLGTVWRTEACWAARIDPHRTTASVPDDLVLEGVRDVRPRMQLSARTGTEARERSCYGLRGRPCSRCGTKIRSGHLGDDNRPVFWCPGCQT